MLSQVEDRESPNSLRMQKTDRCGATRRDPGGCSNLGSYLWGRRFRVRADHKPLVWVDRRKTQRATKNRAQETPRGETQQLSWDRTLLNDKRLQVVLETGTGQGVTVRHERYARTQTWTVMIGWTPSDDDVLTQLKTFKWDDAMYYVYAARPQDRDRLHRLYATGTLWAPGGRECPPGGVMEAVKHLRRRCYWWAIPRTVAKVIAQYRAYSEATYGTSRAGPSDVDANAGETAGRGREIIREQSYEAKKAYSQPSGTNAVKSIVPTVNSACHLSRTGESQNLRKQKEHEGGATEAYRSPEYKPQKLPASFLLPYQFFTHVVSMGIHPDSLPTVRCPSFVDGLGPLLLGPPGGLPSLSKGNDRRWRVGRMAQAIVSGPSRPLSSLRCCYRAVKTLHSPVRPRVIRGGEGCVHFELKSFSSAPPDHMKSSEEGLPPSESPIFMDIIWSIYYNKMLENFQQMFSLLYKQGTTVEQAASKGYATTTLEFAKQCASEGPELPSIEEGVSMNVTSKACSAGGESSPVSVERRTSLEPSNPHYDGSSSAPPDHMKFGEEGLLPSENRMLMYIIKAFGECKRWYRYCEGVLEKVWEMIPFLNTQKHEEVSNESELDIVDGSCSSGWTTVEDDSIPSVNAMKHEEVSNESELDIVDGSCSSGWTTVEDDSIPSVNAMKHEEVSNESELDIVDGSCSSGWTTVEDDSIPSVNAMKHEEVSNESELDIVDGSCSSGWTTVEDDSIPSVNAMRRTSLEPSNPHYDGSSSAPPDHMKFGEEGLLPSENRMLMYIIKAFGECKRWYRYCEGVLEKVWEMIPFLNTQKHEEVSNESELDIVDGSCSSGWTTVEDDSIPSVNAMKHEEVSNESELDIVDGSCSSGWTTVEDDSIPSVNAMRRTSLEPSNPHYDGSSSAPPDHMKFGEEGLLPSENRMLMYIIKAFGECKRWYRYCEGVLEKVWEMIPFLNTQKHEEVSNESELDIVDGSCSSGWTTVEDDSIPSVNAMKHEEVSNESELDIVDGSCSSGWTTVEDDSIPSVNAMKHEEVSNESELDIVDGSCSSGWTTVEDDSIPSVNAMKHEEVSNESELDIVDGSCSSGWTTVEDDSIPSVNAMRRTSLEPSNPHYDGSSSAPPDHMKFGEEGLLPSENRMLMYIIKAFGECKRWYRYCEGVLEKVWEMIPFLNTQKHEEVSNESELDIVDGSCSSGWTTVEDDSIPSVNAMKHEEVSDESELDIVARSCSSGWTTVEEDSIPSVNAMKHEEVSDESELDIVARSCSSGWTTVEDDSIPSVNAMKYEEVSNESELDILDGSCSSGWATVEDDSIPSVNAMKYEEVSNESELDILDGSCSSGWATVEDDSIPSVNAMKHEEVSNESELDIVDGSCSSGWTTVEDDSIPSVNAMKHEEVSNESELDIVDGSCSSGWTTVEDDSIPSVNAMKHEEVSNESELDIVDGSCSSGWTTVEDDSIPSVNAMKHEEVSNESELDIVDGSCSSGWTTVEDDSIPSVNAMKHEEVSNESELDIVDGSCSSGWTTVEDDSIPSVNAMKHEEVSNESELDIVARSCSSGWTTVEDDSIPSVNAMKHEEVSNESELDIVDGSFSSGWTTVEDDSIPSVNAMRRTSLEPSNPHYDGSSSAPPDHMKFGEEGLLPSEHRMLMYIIKAFGECKRWYRYCEGVLEKVWEMIPFLNTQKHEEVSDESELDIVARSCSSGWTTVEEDSIPSVNAMKHEEVSNESELDIVDGSCSSGWTTVEEDSIPSVNAMKHEEVSNESELDIVDGSCSSGWTTVEDDSIPSVNAMGKASLEQSNPQYDGSSSAPPDLMTFSEEGLPSSENRNLMCTITVFEECNARYRYYKELLENVRKVISILNTQGKASLGQSNPQYDGSSSAPPDLMTFSEEGLPSSENRNLMCTITVFEECNARYRYYKELLEHVRKVISILNTQGKASLGQSNPHYDGSSSAPPDLMTFSEEGLPSSENRNLMCTITVFEECNARYRYYKELLEHVRKVISILNTQGKASLGQSNPQYDGSSSAPPDLMTFSDEGLPSSENRNLMCTITVFEECNARYRYYKELLENVRKVISILNTQSQATGDDRSVVELEQKSVVKSSVLSMREGYACVHEESVTRDCGMNVADPDLAGREQRERPRGKLCTLTKAIWRTRLPVSIASHGRQQSTSRLDTRVSRTAESRVKMAIFPEQDL
ncbi:hypothetical protein AAG570_005896 [Ranatra chinensis]|uniref:Uncharacterized protein n=1 Tax=Ranatra chinensis TaxID=642074 RepID=A0ABD0XWG1_9HEMI